MDRVQKQVKRDEVLDLLAELSVKDKSKRKHILENRIYYFGNYDEALDAEFPDLKLKGANPMQRSLLDAWDDPRFKIFTFTGGNRCLGGEQAIYDPVKRVSMPVCEIDGNFHVYA